MQWRALLAGGAERVGWKIGRGIAEGHEHLEPVIGHLTCATQLGRDGIFRDADARDLRVDAEVAIEVGVGGEVAAYGAALELVDVHRPPDDFEGIVAANIWHRAFTLGPVRPSPPNRGTVATVNVNSELRGSAAVGESYAEAIPAASRLLAAVGERLEPGDRIIAGSLVHVAVAAGDDDVVDLGSLGGVSVRIS